MGLLSRLLDAAGEANQDAHGERLLAEFYDSVGRMSRMPPAQSDEVISRFVDKRGKLHAQIWNWTNDGKLKMSKTLRDEARKLTDFNLTEGYALWMTSAWLEAQMRSSNKARTVFGKLDELARAHESVVSAEPQQIQSRERQSGNKADEGMPGLDVLIELAHQVFRDLGIELPESGETSFLDPDELSEQESMTVAAAILGIAGAMAMETKAPPQAVVATSVAILTRYGFNKRLAHAGCEKALEQYKPNPTEHYGIAAWRGSESVRRYRQGIDEEFNAIYPVSWVFDHKW